MESQKTIKLYVYVDGVNDVPFYGSDVGDYEAFILSNGEQLVTKDGFVFNVRNTNEQIELGSFRYDAKRMGSAPTISFTLMYEDCLDNFWSENVYALFNGEKYFLKQTPTSSKSNEDARYKHEVELISERVMLDNVYLFDAVKGDDSDTSSAVTNSATFSFFGSIAKFADKLNSSLEYAGLREIVNGEVKGWTVIVDSDVTLTDEKFISFDKTFFSNAIQESYNTFEVPYYFKGREIHFGYTDNVITREFSYGVDDALLSITKSNSNYKVVNRATATGSSENIPYYYPNSSPKGTIEAKPNGNFNVTILDNEVFANSMDIDEELIKTNANYDVECEFTSGQTFSGNFGAGGKKHSFDFELNVNEVGSISVTLSSNVTKYTLNDNTIADANFETKYKVYLFKNNPTKLYSDTVYESEMLDSVENLSIPISEVSSGYKLSVTVYYQPTGKYQGKGGNITYNVIYDLGSKSGWTYKGESIELKDFGLKVDDNTSVGSTITQKLVNRVKTSNVLLPPKYRETKGDERFYNATNDTYLKEGSTTEYIVFNNPFVEGKPKEHIVAIDDIKPTIKGKKVNGFNIDMFSEFGYDDDDNDETYVDEEDNKTYYKHPYFFGKLRKLDFNLFDHAIESQPMMIEMTSGDCGACKFEIGATEGYPQYNPVQINEDGTLKKDSEGRVICGINEDISEDDIQPKQQDTINNEVWIALKKEEDTYGMIMPNKTLKPKSGDTFVITGINLPQSYITDAEERLEKEIIKYLQDNNDEKFKFSIKFSRIFFEENPSILELLDENAKMFVWYNGVKYTLFVTSISYHMGEGDILPEITVELDDTLEVSQNALQNAINQVKSQVGNALNNIDYGTIGTNFFIRKDQDDEAQGVVNFRKGIKFGEGGKVTMYDNNSAKLTIEYLEVTKKATFTSLEIQEKTHVGGQILITPAAMNCGEVENIYDENGNLTAYRCYFQTKGENGEEIFNQFVVGDQAICQTFNAWGSKYYWRLVVGIGEDYIDLSITDCDEESDIPEAGDKIIQLGHRTDKARQAAQVLSAYGETSPSTIMYNGINSFSLEGKNITGTWWNPTTQEPQMYSYGDFFFGDGTTDEDGNLTGQFITYQKKKGDTKKKLHINADVTFGSDSEGLSNLSEWTDFKNEIEDDYGHLEGLLGQLQDQIDGVVENYFLEGDPSTETSPVTDWIEGIEDKIQQGYELLNHVGDTYTNIEEFVDETTTPNAGKSWRWCECTALTNITDYVEVTDKNGNIKRLHWHPIADTDALKALEMAARAQATADGKRRVFTDTPYAPYDEGDLWVQGESGDLLVCKKSRTTDGFDASNWDKATKYTDDTSLESFIENEYADDLENLSNQIDKKAETWYQSLDPSASWDTDKLKSEHKGDMWYNTSNGTTQRWNGSTWEKQNVPNEVFDAIDSKKSIYAEKPSSYEANDLWILEKAYTLSGVEYGEGEMVIAKQSSDSFNPEHWTKATKYTDGSNTKNLLANSGEALTSQFEGYKTFLLPIKVNAGDKFTFKAEEIKRIAGTSTWARVHIIDNNGNYIGGYHNFKVGNAETVTNAVHTFTIQSGVNNSIAYCSIYSADTYNGSEGNTVLYSKFSLVKGNEPMSVWEDYQGDNALENLLTVDEVYEGQFTAYTYYGRNLPFNVNAGETYTFCVENVDSSDDVNYGYSIVIDNQASTALSSRIYFQMGRRNCVTLTINSGVKDQPARFLVEKGEGSTATAKITRMSLVRGSIPLITWKANREYLFEAFKNGTTKISKGLVMTQAVMVENEGGTVKGMFNGSNYAKDSTNGTLVLAAGSNGHSEAAMRAATTRIYDSGKIVTNDIVATNADISGKITATSGTIGGIAINEWGLVASSDNIGKISLTTNGGLASTNKIGVIVSVGGVKGQCVDIASKKGHETGLGQSYTHPVGIHVVMGKDEEAFICHSGFFAGLRPKIKTISANEELTFLDHTIYVTSACTITLPNNPPQGQCYKILKSKSLSNVILSGDRFLILATGGNPSSSFTIPTNATTIEITRISTVTTPFWCIDYITH